MLLGAGSCSTASPTDMQRGAELSGPLYQRPETGSSEKCQGAMREKATKQAEPSNMDITKVFLLLKVSKVCSNMCSSLICQIRSLISLSYFLWWRCPTEWIGRINGIFVPPPRPRAAQRPAAASPECPGARRCTALDGFGWCWTCASGWVRVAPQALRVCTPRHGLPRRPRWPQTPHSRSAQRSCAAWRHRACYA